MKTTQVTYCQHRLKNIDLWKCYRSEISLVINTFLLLITDEYGFMPQVTGRFLILMDTFALFLRKCKNQESLSDPPPLSLNLATADYQQHTLRSFTIFTWPVDRRGINLKRLLFTLYAFFWFSSLRIVNWYILSLRGDERNSEESLKFCRNLSSYVSRFISRELLWLLSDQGILSLIKLSNLISILSKVFFLLVIRWWTNIFLFLRDVTDQAFKYFEL